MNQEEQKKIIIETLRKTPLVESACAKAGINRRTFYRWKEEDSVFAKEAEEAQHEGKELVNDAAEGQIIGSIKQGRIQGAMFWLKHNKSEYRNKVEVFGNMKIEDERLTPEEETLLAEVIRVARVKPEEKKSGDNDKPTQ